MGESLALNAMAYCFLVMDIHLCFGFRIRVYCSGVGECLMDKFSYLIDLLTWNA